MRTDISWAIIENCKKQDSFEKAKVAYDKNSCVGYNDNRDIFVPFIV